MHEPHNRSADHFVSSQGVEEQEVDLQHLVSPRMLQTRATVVALESATAGVSAGVALGLLMMAVMRPRTAASLCLPPLALQLMLCLAACGSFAFTRRHQVGRSSPRGDPLWEAWTPLFWALSLFTVATLAAVAVRLAWPGQVHTALFFAGLSGAPLLACVGLRSLAALDGRSQSPLADLAFALGHPLLAGLAVCVGLGLLQGKMTAELTYEAGTGLASIALWTMVFGSRVLWRSRAILRLERRAGRRWPTSERSSRNALLILIFGVLMPVGVVTVALSSAQVSGIELACLAMALSVHGLRHAATTMRYGPDARMGALNTTQFWASDLADDGP